MTTDPADFRFALRARWLVRALCLGAAALLLAAVAGKILLAPGQADPPLFRAGLSVLFFTAVVSAMLLRILPCPRCGRPFSEAGSYWHNFLGRCPHCGLRLAGRQDGGPP